MFSCEAKRPADGAQEGGTISFFSGSPVFLGWRQRETQQIGGAQEEAAAHSDSKGGALHYSEGARLAGGEAAFDLRGKVRNRAVGPYIGLDLLGQLGAELVASDAQPQAQDSLCADFAGYSGGAVPCTQMRTSSSSSESTGTSRPSIATEARRSNSFSICNGRGW